MKKFIILALLVGFTLASTAQEKKSMTGDFAIALVPQYAIYNGIRLDFDFKIKPNQVLTLAPMFNYAYKSEIYYPDATNYTGGGLKVNYRYFPQSSGTPVGGYLGMGLHYKYTSVEYSSFDYYNYEEDGLTYQSYGEMDKEESFHQGGYDLLVGYQWIFDDLLIMDLYCGWGFRASGFDPDKAGNDSFWAETIFDPAYSGFTPLLGFRVGLFLK